MEFTKSQIAALVLGYLKGESLYSVVTEFMKCCPYLEENTRGLRNGKYVVTKVAGLRLVDFLEQYAIIYNIVHGKLEDTGDLDDNSSLVEKIFYLLDKGLPPAASSPPETTEHLNVSEVETTPVDTLPGNINNEENDSSPTETPQRNTSKCRSRDREIVTPAINCEELAQKIAENINIVRSTPELAKPVTEENISAGASKELDAVIKTVLQKTEEDPVYNNLIEEIVGAIDENDLTSCNETSPSSSQNDATKPSNENIDTIDDHNNDAIRSIIEAAQIPAPPPALDPPKTENAPVYVYDGNLESFLKTSGTTTTLNTNPVYFNPPLVVLPPDNSAANKFFIVNNPPLLNMTEKEIMSIPTIIVSDNSVAPVQNKPPATRSRRIKSKSELSTTTPKVVKKVQAAEEAAPTQAPPTRPASHVRNLDFSTPSCRAEPEKPVTNKKKKKGVWDEDLRMLVRGSKDKSPSPKKKRPVGKKKSVAAAAEKEEEALQTPVKDVVPKTPGGDLLQCTPFNDVLEEQLIGVDLTTIPTPSIPITPGFALTPGDLVPYNHRSTDYSTSSSYYQPSDTEQNRSIEQLIEECKRLETTSPPPDRFSNLKILSDVVIEQSKVPVDGDTKSNCSDQLKKFNNSVIGKKNLNLLKRQPTTSSSSSTESESDSETSNQQSNSTVICKTNTKKKTAENISEIINKVEVKDTLDKETSKKNLLSHLEQVRLRTIQKIKNPEPPKRKPPVRNNRKATQTKKATTRKSKKKEEEKADEEAQKLVKGLAQRGIHLVPNKHRPKTEKVKKPAPPPPPPPPVDDYIFERKIYDDFEIVVYDAERKPRELSSYDLCVLQKTMSVKVFDDDRKEEVPRVFRWTNFEDLLDFRAASPPKKAKKTDQEVEDELMDGIFAREGSPETKQPAKGGKKRKSKCSEDESKQIEKKTKTYENNIKLLKKIDVDTFLDKVHGE